MKVLFDGYWYQNGPPSGRMVVRELISAWQTEFPNDEVGVASSDQATLPYAGRNLVQERVRLKPHAVSVLLELGRIASKGRYDVVISQNITPITKALSVTFVHDVLFQSNPDFFSWKERIYLQTVPHSLRWCDLPLTSSQTEATRITHHNPGVASVRPVGISVGTELLAIQEERPSGLPPHIDGFFLAVGRLNRRKNLSTVIDACGKTTSVSPNNPLLIVGSPDGLEDTLSESSKRLIADGSVVYLGAVSNANLRWLYQQAQCLVFLSLDEGFGLPPLEALHFGCPVIVSDIPVLREIYEGYAHFVPPTDASAVAEVLSQMRRSPRSQKRPAAQPDYSWPQTVRKIRAAISERIDSANYR